MQAEETSSHFKVRERCANSKSKRILETEKQSGRWSRGRREGTAARRNTHPAVVRLSQGSQLRLGAEGWTHSCGLKAM